MAGKPRGWRQPLESQGPQGENSVAEPILTVEQRNNPAKLTGDDLRHLAHRMGLARSSLADMSDDIIREQIKYLTYRQYDAA